MKKRILSLALVLGASLMLASCDKGGPTNADNLPDTNKEIAEAAVKVGSNVLVDGKPLRIGAPNTIDAETPVVLSHIAKIKAWTGSEAITLEVPLTWSLDADTVSSGLWTLTENDPDEQHDTYIPASKEYVEGEENAPQKVVLTCSAAWAEETASLDYNINVNVTPPVSNDYVKTLEDGATYKFGLYQKTIKEFLFFNGAMSNTYYFGTVNNYAAAVDVQVGASGDGWTMLIKGGTLSGKYIGTAPSGDHLNIKAQDEPFVWNMDEETGAFTGMCGEEEVYMGTYGNKKTISVSAMSHLDGADTCIAHFYSEDPTK